MYSIQSFHEIIKLVRIFVYLFAILSFCRFFFRGIHVDLNEFAEWILASKNRRLFISVRT